MMESMLNTKLVIYGGLTIVLGTGFIVVSGLTAVLSKVLIITGIGLITYGTYKMLNPEQLNEQTQ